MRLRTVEICSCKYVNGTEDLWDFVLAKSGALGRTPQDFQQRRLRVQYDRG